LNIAGNEEADKAAKEGATLPHPTEPCYTLASLKRLVKEKAKDSLVQLWSATAPQNYQDLGIKYTLDIIELGLNRGALGRILASRSCHGDFAAYHRRFNHPDATLNCSCGRPKSPLHFYFCSKSKARQLAQKAPTGESIPYLLGTTKGAQILTGWIIDSRFFTDVCKPHSRLESSL